MPVDDRDVSAVHFAPASPGMGVEEMGTVPQVTLFICTNGARYGLAPTSAARLRPSPLPVKWPFRAHEIMVPCTGKLQPEHLLKAFEAGADLVGVIACDEKNCHYLEGSRRAKRRIEYVRGLLDELGLGGERLRLFHLPGSASEDLALGCGAGAQKSGAREGEFAERLKATGEELAGKLKVLGLSPLRTDRNGGPEPNRTGRNVSPTTEHGA